MKIYYIVFSLVGLICSLGLYTKYKEANQARKEQAEEQAELDKKLRQLYAKSADKEIERYNQEMEGRLRMAQTLREAQLKLDQAKRESEARGPKK